MKCIEKLVNEVYNSCKIPFQLIMHDVGEYSTPQFEIAQNEVNRDLFIITLSAASK